MTPTIERLLSQLKDKSYRQYRIYESATPILYPLDMFGFHMGTGQRLPQEPGAHGGAVRSRAGRPPRTRLLSP